MNLVSLTAFPLLHQILRNYHLLNMVQMNALRHINNVYCCTLIDETRLLIGCDDSMICCDLDIHAYHRLSSSKRFYAIVYVQSEQLIVALSGKQRAIKLIPIRALDNENIEWIKIAESKNATTFTVAYDSGVAYVAVAVRKTLHIFEITRKKARYAPHREIQMPVNIQTLNSCRGNLIAVGTSSNFIVYHVNRSETPLCKFSAYFCVKVTLYLIIYKSPPPPCRLGQSRVA